ncbi:MAG TPA: TolC family protein, partial [Pirellulales bacterium]|nr:TolC family protein [Pirellulales bacterium]
MRTLAAALVVASIGCQQVPIRPPVERSSVGLVEPAIEAAAEPSQLPAEPTIEQTSATQEITPLPPVRAALLIENEAIDPGAAQPAHAPNESPMLRLSLFDAIETGLLQNPDLTVLRQNEGVSLGALGVARTYPFNPYIQVQATPIQSQKADTVHDTIYQYVLVMQTIQLAHQQRRREEIGMAALTSVRWNILQAELLNVAQTERLYFTALYQRGIRDLVRQNADLNQELLATSQRQLEAGHVSGADVAIVRIDSQSTQTQAELAEANYQTALLDLRRQLNIPLEQPLDLTGELTDWQWLAGDADRLLEAKCPGSCVVAAAGSMAAASEAIADLVSG